MEPQQLRARLERLVRQAAGSPGFRRALAERPGEAFAAMGLAAPACSGLDRAAPATAPPVTDALLHGLGSGAGAEPLAARTEMLLLCSGARPMALVHAPEADASALAAWARRRGFHALLSPHEFVPAPEVERSGYSNGMAARRPAQPGSGWWRGLLLSRSPDHVILGWLALLYDWHDLLGGLLGYPRCCRAAFERRWPEALARTEGDVALIAAGEPAKDGGDSAFPWQANVFARYFGFELIQHFPCRFDCPETEKIAARQYRQLRAFAPDLARALRDCLESPVLVEQRSVAILRGGSAAEGGIAYDPARLLGGAAGGEGESLRRNSFIRREMDGRWSIGGRPLKARLLRFDGGRAIPSQELAA